MCSTFRLALEKEGVSVASVGYVRVETGRRYIPPGCGVQCSGGVCETTAILAYRYAHATPDHCALGRNRL